MLSALFVQHLTVRYESVQLAELGSAALHGRYPLQIAINHHLAILRGEAFAPRERGLHIVYLIRFTTLLDECHIVAIQLAHQCHGHHNRRLGALAQRQRLVRGVHQLVITCFFASPGSKRLCELDVVDFRPPRIAPRGHVVPHVAAHLAVVLLEQHGLVIDFDRTVAIGKR